MGYLIGLVVEFVKLVVYVVGMLVGLGEEVDCLEDREFVGEVLLVLVLVWRG